MNHLNREEILKIIGDHIWDLYAENESYSNVFNAVVARIKTLEEAAVDKALKAVATKMEYEFEKQIILWLREEILNSLK